jgi:hypothetical protein
VTSIVIGAIAIEVIVIEVIVIGATAIETQTQTIVIATEP